MNARRHRHYRRALVLILAFEENAGLAESELVRELAQDMLLTRDPDTEEIDALLDPLALTLARMVDEEILSLAVATEIWREVQSCGPPLLQRRSLHEQLEVAAGGTRT